MYRQTDTPARLTVCGLWELQGEGEEVQEGDGEPEGTGGDTPLCTGGGWQECRDHI